MVEVEKEISDGRMLNLIHKFLKQNVLDGLKEWTPDGGTPAGGGDKPLAGECLP